MGFGSQRGCQTIEMRYFGGWSERLGTALEGLAHDDCPEGCWRGFTSCSARRGSRRPTNESVPCEFDPDFCSERNRSNAPTDQGNPRQLSRRAPSVRMPELGFPAVPRSCGERSRTTHRSWGFIQARSLMTCTAPCRTTRSRCTCSFGSSILSTLSTASPRRRTSLISGDAHPGGVPRPLGGRRETEGIRGRRGGRDADQRCCPGRSCPLGIRYLALPSLWTLEA